MLAEAISFGAVNGATDGVAEALAGGCTGALVFSGAGEDAAIGTGIAGLFMGARLGAVLVKTNIPADAMMLIKAILITNIQIRRLRELLCLDNRVQASASVADTDKAAFIRC